MLFDLQHNSPALGAVCADIIARLRIVDAQSNITALLRESEIGNVASGFYPGNEECPKMFAMASNDAGIIAIDGTETFSQGLALWNAYTEMNGESIQLPTNPYLTNAAAIAKSLALSTGALECRRLLVTGWSLGGAIGSAYVADRIANRSTQQIRLVTLGAPRPGNRQMAALLNNARVARWFNEFDPVPILPPGLADWPYGLALYGVNALRRMENFAHPAGGLQVTSGGAIESREVPEGAVADWTTSIAAWLLGLDGDIHGPHGIATYKTVLETAVSLRQGASGALPGGSSAERPLSHNASDRTEAERRFALSLSRSSLQQHMSGIEFPAERGFQVVELAEGWSVVLGSSIIGLSPHRKTVAAFVRTGNDLLRGLQGLALVDTAAVIRALTEYFELATVPGNGFDPTIATVLP